MSLSESQILPCFLWIPAPTVFNPCVGPLSLKSFEQILKLVYKKNQSMHQDKDPSRVFSFSSL